MILKGEKMASAPSSSQLTHKKIHFDLKNEHTKKKTLRPSNLILVCSV